MERTPLSTHSCLCFMLKFAQCFGMLPVCGITGPNYSFLSFRWTSKRTLYSLLFIIMATLNTIFQTLLIIKVRKIQFGELVTLLFFAVTVLTVMIFLDVARKWPHLMKKWTEVDMAMVSYGYPYGLHKKLKIVAMVVITAAIVEHSLFLAFAAKYSPKGENFLETIDLYFKHFFDHVFNILPYCAFLGITIQILNTFSTVSWNFMDLFIMLVSLSLSARFKQVVAHVVLLAKKKETNENVWRNVREDYTRLTSLCGVVDDAISTIILVSFGNNIFVVLVQLYFSLQRPPSNGILDKVYFLYSFSFLIIRTIAVALYAATINSESTKPKHYLNIINHQVHNIEIERFLYQTKDDNVALTGHKLFKVTKSLILTVAAAIVSYELVLIQFHVG